MRAASAIALAAAALALAGAAPASAKSDDCPARKGTLVKKPLGRVWHKGHSLFGCTVVFDTKPRARRLGPWAPQTRVDFDGVEAAWTTPLVRNGVRSDRVWNASVQSGTRWALGARLVPGREARIQRIMVADQSAAWVTRTGDVVLFVRLPNSDPVAVGGLPGPLVPDKSALLLGTFAGIPAKALAATAKLAEGQGDGDECGGTNPYTLTVQPDASAPPVGATWSGDWVRVDC
jgi:hypothetical protein